MNGKNVGNQIPKEAGEWQSLWSRGYCLILLAKYSS